MSFTVLVRTAWKALLRNISRSLLTMLGIIIGVGAVIASVAIGAGAITDATGGATAGTQVGISGGAGSADIPPSMLARLAKEASDARKNAACDSAMARWKTAWASAVWRWLS